MTVLQTRTDRVVGYGWGIINPVILLVLYKVSLDELETLVDSICTNRSGHFLPLLAILGHHSVHQHIYIALNRSRQLVLDDLIEDPFVDGNHSTQSQRGDDVFREISNLVRYASPIFFFFFFYDFFFFRYCFYFCWHECSAVRNLHHEYRVEARRFPNGFYDLIDRYRAVGYSFHQAFGNDASNA